MASPRRVGVVEDPRYRDHAGPEGHPERPERLVAVGEALAARSGEWTAVAPRAAGPEEILRVHDRAHLDHLTRAADHAPTRLDPDTYLGTRSLPVAHLAAGASIDLVLGVCRGELDAGLAAVRPPGHHAEADRAMGFCLLNNAAIAARAAQAEAGVERILLLDWDVHHGNGTQHSFESDPSVLYLSSHQYPYYPGTGAASEAGSGKGFGATVNVPLPATCGDAEYVGVMQRVLVPVAERFRPELVLVSCGFDSHADDPLAAMLVSGPGFRAMTQVVRQLADTLCGGRLVLLLEGGYALSGLREGTEAVLDVLLDPAPPTPETVPVERGTHLEAALGRVRDVHAAHFPGLGSA
ncbi:MAG: histone deacetylase family protein [Myxococcota bacterium]